MSNESGTRIAIVGAGLAGALLACLLGEAGYEVTVFEGRPDPRRKGLVGGRSINLALSVRGIHALKQAGLADAVLEDAIPMRGRMIHSPAGQLSLQPYSKNPKDAINSVSRGGLNLTLLARAGEHPNVRLCFGQRCTSADLDAPSVRLARDDNGRESVFQSDVIIGCDGAFSAVRGQLQRIDRFEYEQSYLEHGYTELTIPPASHGGFAMDAHALHIWPRGGFMMIALPNRDHTFTCTLFWPFAGRNSFEAVQTPDQIVAFFRKNFPDAVPLMPTLVEDYQQNPVSSLVTVRCGPWHYRDKVVLVGDAAHAIVPFYGQGMNAAFEDCVVLAECLRECNPDRQGAFERYYRRRKANADAIADLAIENFREMRDDVASPVFRLKKTTQRALHRLVPQWYTPLYNMVTFTRIPYAEARRRARRQSRILAAVGLAAAVLLLLVLVWAIS